MFVIGVLAHPPHSPDLVTCDFMFQKVKQAFKWTRFENVEVVKEKVMETMKIIVENELKHCFE